MSVFNGKNLSVEIFGESHSEKIGAVVKGFPKFSPDFDQLNGFLSRRKAGGGVFSTARIEADEPVFEGVSDGTIDGEFSFYILNRNVKSRDYDNLYGKPRPNHADICAYLKDGTLSFTGGGRFSGRLTAPFCVVGGICKQYLEARGIRIAAFIAKTGNVNGLSYKDRKLTVDEIENKRTGEYPSLDKKAEMKEEIKNAKADCDSVGGRIECVISGLPAGMGDNMFGGLEGMLSSAIYAVPAVKGVEFGLGFGFCDKRASEVNDEMFYQDGKIKFYSENAGGIYGGIACGEDVTIGVAVKPTPSISKPQRTVDLANKTNAEIKIVGRHDACILPRAVPVIESAAAIALTDEIIAFEKENKKPKLN